VNCGDHVWVQVQQNCYNFGNLSSHVYWSICTGPWAGGHTAEAIVERSEYNGVFQRLANFGIATFRGVGITEANLGYQPIWNLWHDYSHMYNKYDSTKLANTNGVWYDGSDYPYDVFSVSWLNEGWPCPFPC
jgi:hypothetical protein